MPALACRRAAIDARRVATIEIRELTIDDGEAYRGLRVHALEAFPEAFGSDAAAERTRDASSYRERLTAGDGGFTLGAFVAGELVGAVTLFRDARVKTHHLGEVRGVMVRATTQRAGIGRRLMEGLIARATADASCEQLTLTVSADNDAAVALYGACGFVRFGSLPRAIRVDERWIAKDFMYRPLRDE